MAVKRAAGISKNEPSICTCVNLRRASRAITRIYDQALQPSKLKVTQYSVLANIMRSGPINVSNLSRILSLDRTTLVRNLKALEAAGYIEEGTASDPRERSISISETGRQAVETALPCWKAAQQRVQEQLGADHIEQLRGLVLALEELSGDTGPEIDQ